MIKKIFLFVGLISLLILILTSCQKDDTQSTNNQKLETSKIITKDKAVNLIGKEHQECTNVDYTTIRLYEINQTGKFALNRMADTVDQGILPENYKKENLHWEWFVVTKTGQYTSRTDTCDVTLDGKISFYQTPAL